MLIAISGSQGTGKTTLIQSLKQKHYRTIQRKTARSILQEWNVTLEQVYADKQLTRQFQDEILDRKDQDEREYIGHDVALTERSYTDLFVYTTFLLGNDNNSNQWVNDYYNKCVTNNQRYSLVIYLQGGKFEVEDDGVRGINQHYSRVIDLAMIDYTKRMFPKTKIIMIKEKDLIKRVELVDRVIQKEIEHNQIPFG